MWFRVVELMLSLVLACFATRLWSRSNSLNFYIPLGVLGALHPLRAGALHPLRAGALHPLRAGALHPLRAGVATAGWMFSGQKILKFCLKGKY